MLVSQTPLRPYTTGSATLTTTLTYLPGANGSKTGMIASYRNGTEDAYTYTYDANGNIVSITKGSLSFTYAYDAANQLIREDLYYGPGSSNNATYTYEYDAWGNILNKKEYAYTTGTLGAVLNTVTYSYTDSQWGDLLTSFNGRSITYDAMGNMTSYGNKTYTWEGKQLVGINVMGMIQYSFAYDENGLRTRKTMTAPNMGVEDITEYYYNGSVLIGMYIAADHVPHAAEV